MYLNFYQLQVEPFDITPDPDFLLLNDSYKEALGAITYGIQHRKGFISVVGEVGTGKTTLLHAYLNRRDREKLIAIYIFDPSLSFDELVEECAIALGVDVANATPGRKIQRLHWALLNAFKAGKNVALIIDEAQNLPVETLEKLRMLSNFETDKNKLMQLVLVGQPELRTKLNLHELRQLKQRVALTAEVGPLTYRESLQYIDHRIKIASYGRRALFTRGAKRLIAKKAEGIPRNINVLADNALIAGYATSERPVRRNTVKSVLHDRSRAQDEPWNGFPAIRRALLAAAFVAAVGVVGGIYGSTLERQPAGATESPRAATVLPEPMAANETQQSTEEPAEPESSKDAGATFQSADLLADLDSDAPVNALTLPPAPATGMLPTRLPAGSSREPDIHLDVIEPTRTEMSPVEASAAEDSADTLSSDREHVEVNSTDDSAENGVERARRPIDPRVVQLAAAEQMIVLHPVIPPFRLDLDEASLEESAAATDATEAGAPSASKPRSAEKAPAEPRSASTAEPATPSESVEASGDEDAQYSRIWRVRRGEFLWGIALRNYGYVDDDLVERIRRANPRIPNINLIHPGDRLLLPPIDRIRRTQARPQ